MAKNNKRADQVAGTTRKALMANLLNHRIDWIHGLPDAGHWVVHSSEGQPSEPLLLVYFKIL